MRMTVEREAALWYKEQMGLADGDSLRVFVRLGGSGGVHPGMSLGIIKDTPRDAGLSRQVEGITFYMEQDNVWYVGDKELRISFDPRYEEISMEVV